jgi:hypothetical protein
LFSLQRNAALPRNKVGLAVAHGAYLEAAGYLHHVVEDALAGLLDGFFTVDDGAGR